MKQTLTPQAAKDQGFTVDRTCYPWFAYKGPRFKPTEFAYCFTDLEAAQHAASFKERSSVLAFQQKFGIPMATTPSWLPSHLFEFRYGFMHEELAEFEQAHIAGDMHGAADALIDLAYVLHGTALMMGLPWPMLWAEVQRANMQKVRAKHADESKRGSSFDVVKPAGWKGPDHTAALGTGPWPMLKLEEAKIWDVTQPFAEPASWETATPVYAPDGEMCTPIVKLSKGSTYVVGTDGETVVITQRHTIADIVRWIVSEGWAEEVLFLLGKDSTL